MSVADQYERFMLELINAERAKAGVKPLKLELHLNESAERHSEWMLAADKFSHTGEGGSSPTARMRDAGFDFSGSWRSGENVAWQSERGASGIMDDVANLHQNLMNSPGHRANILRADFDYVGIGIEFGKFNNGSWNYDAVMVTQNFAKTGGSVALDTGSAPAPTPAPAPVPDPTPIEEPVLVSDVPTNGDDNLTGTMRADDIRAKRGDDVIKGLDGNDRLDGAAGHDNLQGGNGKDRLYGGSGNDHLYGGAQRDILAGGRGTDQLFGQGGNDRFVFRKGNQTDVVRDFQDEIDQIDLRSLDFANRGAAMREATQKGADVHFDFDGDDYLIIRGATLEEVRDDLVI